MAGDSWRGEKDPALARADAFSALQVATADVERLTKEIESETSTLRSLECRLENAQQSYERAIAALETLLPPRAAAPKMEGIPTSRRSGIG
jgi:hypothetical protein